MASEIVVVEVEAEVEKYSLDEVTWLSFLHVQITADMYK